MVLAFQGHGHLGAADGQGAADWIQPAHPIGLPFKALTLQGHPNHPALPGRRQGLIQEGVAGRDHHQAIGRQTGGDFTFGGGNRPAAAQAADVGRADVGDHSHRGLGAEAEAFNLTQAAHAHFHHHGPVLGIGLQQGERYTDVVVFVAAGGEHGPQGLQGRADHLPGCRFTGRAGHGNHRHLEPKTPQRTELLVGHKGVVHPPERAALLLRQRHQGSPSPWPSKP